MGNKVCLIKYKDETFSSVKFANQSALQDPELASNIAELSDFEKSLLRDNRLSRKNGRDVVETASGARSRLFDGLYVASNNPMKDYEYVHSNDFTRVFGDWKKAQREWLSGDKTWIQAVRSNRLDESLLDENLEPRVQVLYPNTQTRENKVNNKKLNQLMERAGVGVKIRLQKIKSDEDLIRENFEEAQRLLGQEVEDVVGTITSFRPDIVEQLRSLDARTKAYYDSKEKAIVYVPDDNELNSILEQLNAKRLCL